MLDIFFNGRYEKDVSTQKLGEILKDKNHFLITYTAEDGVIAAMALGIKVQTLSRTVMLYEELIVDPEYRRQGIGTSIDEFVIELAKEEGCDCIEGTVATENVAVQLQHLKTGFKFRSQLPVGISLIKWQVKGQGDD